MVGKHGPRTTFTKKVFTKNTITTETSAKKATSSPTILSKVIAPETFTKKASCTPSTTAPLTIRKQRGMDFDLRVYALVDPSTPYNPDEWEDELVYSDDENVVDDDDYRGIGNNLSQIIITQDNIANDV